MAKRNVNKAVKKAAKKYPKAFIAVLAVLLVIAIVVLAVMYVKKIGPFKPAEPPVATGTKAEIVNADLSVHFLELGNKYTGDCTLIKVGNTEVLIDAGSRKNSAATISAYIDEYCTDGVLEYVIATHAHQDHIAGFVGNTSGTEKTGVLYKYEIGTLIQFSLTNATSAIYNEYCQAVEYAKSRGTEVYTEKK